MQLLPRQLQKSTTHACPNHISRNYLLNGRSADDICTIEEDTSFNMAAATMLIPPPHPTPVINMLKKFNSNFNTDVPYDLL